MRAGDMFLEDRLCLVRRPSRAIENLNTLKIPAPLPNVQSFLRSRSICAFDVMP